MTITETTAVADIASAVPASVRVFQQHGIDFCCGGKTPLGIACEEQGISFAEVATAIEAAATSRGTGADNWNQAPLPALINHIVSTYHDTLRSELPRLEGMAAKVARVHGAKAPFLTRLDAILSEMSTELQSHMRKEEAVLFPAIGVIAQGTGRPGMRIAAPIAMMMHEHDHAGAALAELRSMTDDYVAPDWACGTFRALYAGLAEFEAAMHVHVHLENNILFPRALRQSESV